MATTNITLTSYPIIWDNGIFDVPYGGFVERGMIPSTFTGYVGQPSMSIGYMGQLEGLVNGVYDDPSARPPRLAVLETSRVIVVRD